MSRRHFLHFLVQSGPGWPGASLGVVCIIPPAAPHRLRANERQGHFWDLVMGSLVERGSAGASKTHSSDVPRLWRRRDWFGSLTRPAIPWDVSRNFLLLVRQTEKDEEKVKTTSFLLGSSAQFLWSKAELENAKLARNVTFLVVLWADRWFLVLLTVA